MDIASSLDFGSSCLARHVVDHKVNQMVAAGAKWCCGFQSREYKTVNFTKVKNQHQCDNNSSSPNLNLCQKESLIEDNLFIFKPNIRTQSNVSNRGFGQS